MNKYIKIAISVIILAVSIYFFTEREIGMGIFIFFLSLIPMVFFFKNERLLLAFWQLRKQDLEGTKKWLGRIKNPKAELVKNQIGYYYYLQGLSEGQDNLKKTEDMMKLALEHGLNFDHDTAMAKMTLAGMAMGKGQKPKAEKLLKEAEKLDKQGMLKEQITMMRSQMKQIQVGRNMHNPHMRRAMQGKRR